MTKETKRKRKDLWCRFDIVMLVCVCMCSCVSALGVSRAGSYCPWCGLGSTRWHCIVQHGQLSVSHKWPHSSSASHTITPHGLISTAHTCTNTWSIPHGSGSSSIGSLGWRCLSL